MHPFSCLGELCLVPGGILGTQPHFWHVYHSYHSFMHSPLRSPMQETQPCHPLPDPSAFFSPPEILTLDICILRTHRISTKFHCQVEMFLFFITTIVVYLPTWFHANISLAVLFEQGWESCSGTFIYSFFFFRNFLLKVSFKISLHFYSLEPLLGGLLLSQYHSLCLYVFPSMVLM